MRRVYFDIETYRPRQEFMFINEKIIAIGLLIEGRSMEQEIILKIWEFESEEALVRTFYNIAKTIHLRIYRTYRFQHYAI